jgi:hypothetical protein
VPPRTSNLQAQDKEQACKRLLELLIGSPALTLHLPRFLLHPASFHGFVNRAGG